MKEKIELNLDNPIFAIYADVSGIPRQKAVLEIQNLNDSFNIYSNITFWIVPSDNCKIECIYDGKYRDRDKELCGLIEELNKRIDILSNSNGFDDFKINIRDWRLENLIKDGK